MKKAVTSLGLIVALSPLASAVAQDDANFYLGGRLGVSTMSDNCPAGDCNDTSEGAGGLILGYDFGNASLSKRPMTTWAISASTTQQLVLQPVT